MFNWFNRNKNEAEVKAEEISNVDEISSANIEETNSKVQEKDNYEIANNGDIKIRAREYKSFYILGYATKMISIQKSQIISHTKNIIVFIDYVKKYNHQVSFGYDATYYIDYTQTMDSKENFIEYKETQIKTYTYSDETEYWELTNTDIVGTEVVLEKTPLDVFNENFKSKYKLIETEEEFNNYLSSTLDCDTWCRMKLYNKMKEVGLGDGFINSFADLVGNNLDRYHAMIDLASEVSDKDTLMYLFTYKFGKK